MFDNKIAMNMIIKYLIFTLNSLIHTRRINIVIRLDDHKNINIHSGNLSVSSKK